MEKIVRLIMVDVEQEWKEGWADEEVIGHISMACEWVFGDFALEMSQNELKNSKNTKTVQ